MMRKRASALFVPQVAVFAGAVIHNKKPGDRCGAGLTETIQATL